MNNTSEAMKSPEDFSTMLSTFAPQDQGAIHDEVLVWFDIIFRPAIVVLSCAGILGNLVNVAVLLKHDLQTPTNIGFLALAFADIGCLISCLAYQAMLTPTYLTNRFAEIVIPGCLFVYLLFVDNYIVLLLTIERCMCVLLPLRVKQLITPMVMKIGLVAVHILLLWFFLPFWATVSFNVEYVDPVSNITRIGSGFRSFIYTATRIINVASNISRFICTGCVFILTIVMVVRLNIYSKMRKNLTARNTIQREKAAIKTVLVIAITLLIFTLPFIAIAVLNDIFAEELLSFDSSYQLLKVVIDNIATLFNVLNVSINIFVYYYMSTKYRNTIKQYVSCLGNTAESSSDDVGVTNSVK